MLVMYKIVGWFTMIQYNYFYKNVTSSNQELILFYSSLLYNGSMVVIRITSVSSSKSNPRSMER